MTIHPKPSPNPSILKRPNKIPAQAPINPNPDSLSLHDQPGLNLDISRHQPDIDATLKRPLGLRAEAKRDNGIGEAESAALARHPSAGLVLEALIGAGGFLGQDLDAHGGGAALQVHGPRAGDRERAAGAHDHAGGVLARPDLGALEGGDVHRRLVQGPGAEDGPRQVRGRHQHQRRFRLVDLREAHFAPLDRRRQVLPADGLGCQPEGFARRVGRHRRWRRCRRRRRCCCGVAFAGCGGSGIALTGCGGGGVAFA